MDDHHHQLVRERGRRIKAPAELGLARSSRSRALGRRALVVPPAEEETSTGRRRQAAPKEATPVEAGRGHQDHREEEKEAAVVEEKVALLRQLVPGGEDMAVEGLLEETADYIAALKAQVGVMRALTCLLAGSDLDDARRPESAAGLVLVSPEKPL